MKEMLLFFLYASKRMELESNVLYLKIIFFFFNFHCDFTKFFFSFFVFLGLHPSHMELPRRGIESELEPPAYTTAIATQDPSCVCKLHHSSGQRYILNPLSDARDWTCVLMDTSQIRFWWAMTGTPEDHFIYVCVCMCVSVYIYIN